ncbi:MAG: L,D-transpeptidase family protein [Methylococcaceae bacterium]|nr:L,D-transpeptidase family protein [Prolixibacteraceae bacterium]
MRYHQNKRIFSLIIFLCILLTGYAQTTAIKNDSARVARFYKTIDQSLFWFSNQKNIQKGAEWLKVIESREVRLLGFSADQALIDQLQVSVNGVENLSNPSKEKADQQITSLALRLLKFLHEGEPLFEYDAFNVNRDSLYISQLIGSQRKGSVESMISTLDCKDNDYLVLKKYLRDSITDKTSVMARKIWLSMNYRRYLSANDYKEMIIVNIPDARAVYYRNKLPTVKMRVVPGKKDDPTPALASYITSIIIFPPWKVPRSIAVNEILPKVQENLNYLEENNFVVVDAKENQVSPKELKWEEYDKDNFPYFFQQLPGPDNSLGVIKFNLKNPLNIYLHATSWQGAFDQKSRFLSHGCVRLERPFELANAILRGEIEREELAKVRDSIATREYPIKRKVPTYLVYMPAVVKGKKVVLLNDIYGLINGNTDK